MRVNAHGLSIDAPAGWDARISRPTTGGPILHVATFPLRPDDGVFGAGATGRMGAGDAFAALVEYIPDAYVRPGVGLFAPRGFSASLDPETFGPSQLEVTRVGQLGHQRFFTEVGRPFCLYAVIAPGVPPAGRLLSALSSVLATVQFPTR